MKTRNVLAGLCFLIFLISLSYSFYYQIIPGSDALGYDRIGWNLARGLGYIEDENNAGNVAEDDAIVRVGPGYEFFLSGVYTIFGHSYAPVWVFQALMRVLTAVFLFLIAVTVFRENTYRDVIGIIAVLIFGLSPDLILINGMLLTETLFITLLVAAVYFSMKFIEFPTLMWSASAGFLFGAAALVRPTALVALLIFLAVLLIRKYYIHAFVILIFPALLLGSWSARNTIMYDTPLFTTTAGAYALWVGNNEDSTGGFDKTPEIQAIRDVNHSVPLSKIAMERYSEFLKNHPFKFAELQFRKTAIYFSLIHPTGSWGFLDGRTTHQAFTLGVSFIWVAALLITGLAGLVLFYLKKIKRFSVLSLLLLLYTAIQPPSIILTYVESRYRYTFFVLLCIMAAYFLVSYWNRDSEDKTNYKLILGWVFLIIIFFTAYDLIYNADSFLDRIDSVFS